MTWETETVPADALEKLLTRIRQIGGTVTASCPIADGVRVTWYDRPAGGRSGFVPAVHGHDRLTSRPYTYYRHTK